MRRLTIVAITVSGLGLFGGGVRGLAQLDGDLADAVDRSGAHEVKRELGTRDDCPWRERPRLPERRRL